MMRQHPRNCCQICGEKIFGGDDTVAYLESKFHSFHLLKHLACFVAQERERIVAELEHRIKGAEADCRDHQDDPEIVQRELAGYLRALKDVAFAIRERKD